jgi:Bacterial protein of unknown function (DUF885)
MGQPPAPLTPTVALDRFFESYYRLRPVTATFTGIHDFDQCLPDWSRDGLGAACDTMRACRDELRAAGRVDDALVRRFPDQVDLALADGFLEIQIAEHEGAHFYTSNPALWTGEAIFSVLSLVTRDGAPLDDRIEAAAARLRAIPSFLNDGRRTMVEAPHAWTAKALRECQAGEILFGHSLPAWFTTRCPSPSMTTNALDAAEGARDAFRSFAAGLEQSLRSADHLYSTANTTPGLELLLRRGHWVNASIETLLGDANDALDEAHARLSECASEAGCRDWAEAQQRLAERHPSRENYVGRFGDVWERARAAAIERELVSWPDAPIRYVPIPEHTREAAPLLYYLFYRSPAAFDRVTVHDYVVTPIDGLPADEQDRRLRAANDSVIVLNHVVHHGGLGHHVQNWHAYRSSSRIGQVAAIDAASRIAMFSGGSLAEGWACYACDLMEEIGFLTPLEQVAQQHTRVRLLARAVADLSLHDGRMSLDEAAALYSTRGLMPDASAKAEAVKTSMFPGTAVMYWLGTKGIHDLRSAIEKREGAAFSLKRFHDRFLTYGAIPVALISRLMLEEA